MTARAPRTGTATLALVAMTAVWGSTFVVIKDVVTRMPVADYLAVRFVVAALVMLAVLGRQALALPRRQVIRGVWLGLAYGAGQLLQTYGLERTSASVSGFITGMYVVLTPVFGALLLRQRSTRVTWLAVALASGGLALLSLRGVAVGAGEALTLASAGVYALHIVGLGAWSRAQDALGMATVQMVVIAAVCTLAALPGGVVGPPDASAWLAIAYTGVIAGAAALLVQTWAQSHLPATRAAIVMTTEPMFAATFAVLLGGEHLTGRILAGGGLVLAAMYLVELAPRLGRRRAGVGGAGADGAERPPAEALHHQE